MGRGRAFVAVYGGVGWERGAVRGKPRESPGIAGIANKTQNYILRPDLDLTQITSTCTRCCGCVAWPVATQGTGIGTYYYYVPTPHGTKRFLAPFASHHQHLLLLVVLVLPCGAVCCPTVHPGHALNTLNHAQDTHISHPPLSSHPSCQAPTPTTSQATFAAFKSTRWPALTPQLGQSKQGNAADEKPLHSACVASPAAFTSCLSCSAARQGTQQSPHLACTSSPLLSSFFTRRNTTTPHTNTDAARRGTQSTRCVRPPIVPLV